MLIRRKTNRRRKPGIQTDQANTSVEKYQKQVILLTATAQRVGEEDESNKTT